MHSFSATFIEGYVTKSAATISGSVEFSGTFDAASSGESSSAESGVSNNSAAYSSAFQQAGEKMANADLSLEEGCPDGDCNLPAAEEYKNEETYYDDKSGRDFILFDNEWHQLPEEEIIMVFYPDPLHPKGGVFVPVSREQNFKNNYLLKTAQKGNIYGALGGGTATQFLMGKLNIFAIGVGSASGGFKNVNDLYKRMEIHDKVVNYQRENNQPEKQ